MSRAVRTFPTFDPTARALDWPVEEPGAELLPALVRFIATHSRLEIARGYDPEYRLRGTAELLHAESAAERDCFRLIDYRRAWFLTPHALVRAHYALADGLPLRLVVVPRFEALSDRPLEGDASQ